MAVNSERLNIAHFVKNVFYDHGEKANAQSVYEHSAAECGSHPLNPYQPRHHSLSRLLLHYFKRVPIKSDRGLTAGSPTLVSQSDGFRQLSERIVTWKNKLSTHNSLARSSELSKLTLRITQKRAPQSDWPDSWGIKRQFSLGQTSQAPKTPDLETRISLQPRGRDVSAITNHTQTVSPDNWRG
ncbi:hypothetical protein J6590_042848 [Homalodisca vitripennis]|nr:hypothetical protein J6590_042848 [Homalodisca vitripennis]